MPAGMQTLKLASVEVSTIPNVYWEKEGDAREVDRTKWKFISKEKSEDGAPYDCVVFTGCDYGWPTAGITKLVDQLVPGMTLERFKTWDSDEIMNVKYQAIIKHELPKGENAKPYAKIVSIMPIGSSKAAAKTEAKPEPAKPAPAPEVDPFADEDEYF